MTTAATAADQRTGPDSTPQPGSAAVIYDPGYPAAVSRGQVRTQPDVIGETHWDAPEADFDISRWVNPSVGGQTGTVNRLGWTSGLWWKRVSFAGGASRGVRRQLAKDAHGPVGRSNYAQQLQAGVAEQFTVPPTLEQIYRGFTGG